MLRSPTHAPRAWILAITIAVLLVGSELRHLGHPLLWNDEGETAMYGQRILTFGYPKADDGRNLVYEALAPLAVAVKQPGSVYIGSTWGQYYVGALGVAFADRVEDPFAKSQRVRLPFALVGLLGLSAFAAILVSLHRDAPGASALPVALLFGLFLLSPSLQLHLREARHYPLMVLLVGLLLLVHLRLHVQADPSRLLALAEALLLVLVFNVFHPGFFLLAAALGMERLLAPRTGSAAQRFRALARDLAPLALAALLVLPIAIYFDVLHVASKLRGTANVDRPSMLNQARALGVFLSQYGELLPALVARGTAVVLARRPGAENESRGLAERLAAARVLWIVSAIYVLLLSAMPIVVERYAIAVLPSLALALVLDLGSCLELVRAWPAARSRRRAFVLGGAAAGLCATILLTLRLPALEGRLHELANPPAGPLDFVVPYLQQTYARPDELLIATNYEAPSLMFYLSSRVIVGYTGARITKDALLDPDVVLPRRQWRPRLLPVLEAFLQRGRYERVSFPIFDLPTNETPSLSESQGTLWTHQFRTLDPGNEEQRLVLFRR